MKQSYHKPEFEIVTFEAEEMMNTSLAPSHIDIGVKDPWGDFTGE